MKALKEYIIKFVGLKNGEHEYTFNVGRAFFESFGYEDYNDLDVVVHMTLEKKSTLMDIHFDIKGDVQVNCDVTNEPFDQDVSADFDLVVKFGDEFNDEEEDLLILPHGAYEFSVAQYIYETIVLAIPQKRIHPGVEDGTLQSDILDKLEELSLVDQDEHTEQEDIEKTDPRWDALKKLLTDK